MNNASTAPIIIIGNGIAGTTFARHFRKKSNHPLLLISDENESFFSRTALMYVFVGHLRLNDLEPYEERFWADNQIGRIKGRVTEIMSTEQKIVLKDGQVLPYKKLVLATGSIPRDMGLKGENSQGVFRLYHKQDLEALDRWCKGKKKSVIVGGGLIGVELAEMLRSRKMEVTYLVRESHFWANALCVEEAQLIANHLSDHQVDLRFNCTLKAIETDRNGELSGCTTQDDQHLECDTMGITIGVRPNVDFLKNAGLNIDKGVVVDEYLTTNIPHIYAIGDCAQIAHPLPHRNAIEAVWYAGRMMGETLAETLTNSPTPYRPGHWFNSAKFFDIEYQTYGEILPLPTKNEAHFLWQSPQENKSLRFAYEKDSKIFKGVSSLGLRLRHEVFDQWLEEKITMTSLLEQLEKANFDPEFSRRYEKQISAKWKEHPHQ